MATEGGRIGLEMAAQRKAVLQRPLAILVTIGLLIAVALWRGPLKETPEEKTAVSPSEIRGSIDHWGTVYRVLDGDTIELAEGEIVRYLGIDAPEKSQPFFSESTEANERLVAGQEVGLELDIQAEDQYGRTLAYVWVGEVLVNLELVRQGFATVYTFPPNVRYADQFLAAERTARAAPQGLWNLGF